MIAWPSVVAALVQILPTLPEFCGVTIFDQSPVTGSQPTDYVTVGYIDGEVAGSFQRARSPMGNRFMDESGTVNCHLVCQAGNVNLPALRARIFTLANAWDLALVNDPTLGGVLAVDATVTLTADVDSLQNQGGSAQMLPLTVAYTTTTY